MSGVEPPGKPTSSLTVRVGQAEAAAVSLVLDFFELFWAVAIVDRAMAAIKSVVRLDNFMQSSSFERALFEQL
ncbi:MAG: hypothetical protein V4706_06360 [Pseudomonadota bacterium]